MRSSATKLNMRIVPYELWTSIRSPFFKDDKNSEEDRYFHKSWAKLLPLWSRLHRKCACTGCTEDKRTQDFFTERRFWWNSRTLWTTTTTATKIMISLWMCISLDPILSCLGMIKNKKKEHNYFLWKMKTQCLLSGPDFL